MTNRCCPPMREKPPAPRIKNRPLTIKEKGVETPYPKCTHLTAVREMMDKIIRPLRVIDPR